MQTRMMPTKKRNHSQESTTEASKKTKTASRNISSSQDNITPNSPTTSSASTFVFISPGKDIMDDLKIYDQPILGTNLNINDLNTTDSESESVSETSSEKSEKNEFKDIFTPTDLAKYQIPIITFLEEMIYEHNKLEERAERYIWITLIIKPNNIEGTIQANNDIEYIEDYISTIRESIHLINEYKGYVNQLNQSKLPEVSKWLERCINYFEKKYNTSVDQKYKNLLTDIETLHKLINPQKETKAVSSSIVTNGLYGRSYSNSSSRTDSETNSQAGSRSPSPASSN